MSEPSSGTTKSRLNLSSNPYTSSATSTSPRTASSAAFGARTRRAASARMVDSSENESRLRLIVSAASSRSRWRSMRSSCPRKTRARSIADASSFPAARAVSISSGE